MKDKKYIYITLTIVFLLAALGISYAWFNAVIKGNDTAKEQSVITGNLELTFTDDTEVTLPNAVPGDSYTKTISVKNTGTLDAKYNLVWQELTNEITNDELVIEATCKRLNSSNTEEGTCESISQTPIKSNTIKKNISIEPSVTHEYTIKVTFLDTGSLQDYNKNKTFEGKLGINESAVKAVYCTYDEELTKGATFVQGNFTYHYKEKMYEIVTGEGVAGGGWYAIDEDGWGVILTNPNSTVPIDTSEVCTYINGKPIVSMSGMFDGSQATSIELSTLDTSNVIYMDYMFNESKATTLDLSSFNTSNVKYMNSMFGTNNAAILNLSSFNTSKVTNMASMFLESQATTLDVSNFDTSNVTNMMIMFAGSQATTIKGLENFDTSNVKYMVNMFSEILVTTLNLNSFNTSNVIDMTGMFSGSNKLKTIYASDKFNTDNCIGGYSEGMFSECTSLVGGAGTTYDEEHTDYTYAHIDGGVDNPGYFTDIKDKSKEPESFATDSWSTIAKAVRDNNISKYNVGDTKTVDMGTYGTHTLRIANTSTPSECSTSGFSQTACGFVLEFADIITTHNMNPNGKYNGTTYIAGWNKDGWPASSMYTFVNTDIYNALPNELKNAIINTIVVSGHGSEDTENFTSTDKLYLLSTAEVWADAVSSSNSINEINSNTTIFSLPAPEIGGGGGDIISLNYDSARDVTRQLDYYKNLGVTTSNYSETIKKNGTSASSWLLRSAISKSDYDFYSVYTNGRWNNGPAFNTNGVAPAFRLG